MITSPLRTTIGNMNHNVKLVFTFSITQSLSRGIWMGNILAAYIFFYSGNSNTLLGWTSAATGITMTIFVFPAGYFADKFRRDIILKSASIIGFAAITILVVDFFIEKNESAPPLQRLALIFISLLLWGMFQGFNRPSIEAILADSTESGNRSGVYSWLHLTRQIAMAFGPFLNVFLFLIFGDEWNLSILRNVMLVGLGISVFSLASMLFFDDKKSLGTQSDSIADELTQQVDDIHNGTAAKMSSERAAKLIPYLLVGSNLIIGVGAGMSIKYFTVFFFSEYDLLPIRVQIIMGLTSIFTGLAGLMARRFSLKRGRAKIIFIAQLAATLCLVTIALYPIMRLPLILLAVVFIARGSLMNSAQPLSRSILMDVIPKGNRGKWNSIEAIAWGLFWNASAVIGGYLVGDSEPYRFWLVFSVTAGIYFLGLIPVFLLIPLVGKEQAKKVE